MADLRRWTATDHLGHLFRVECHLFLRLIMDIIRRQYEGPLVEDQDLVKVQGHLLVKDLLNPMSHLHRDLGICYRSLPARIERPLLLVAAGKRICIVGMSEERWETEDQIRMDLRGVVCSHCLESHHSIPVNLHQDLVDHRAARSLSLRRDLWDYLLQAPYILVLLKAQGLHPLWVWYLRIKTTHHHLTMEIMECLLEVEEIGRRHITCGVLIPEIEREIATL